MKKEYILILLSILSVYLFANNSLRDNYCNIGKLQMGDIENNGELNIGIIKGNDKYINLGNNDIHISFQSGTRIDERENETIKNVIRSDFLVNDDTIGGIFDKCFPNVSMDNTGNFVIVWSDDRNGNENIYAQRYDSAGAVIGATFRVNDDASMRNQRYPSISTDNMGNIVIAWMDNRDGNWDIYAQRYDNNGTVNGINFKVNDDGGVNYKYYPSVSMDNAGDFVIVWQDQRNGDYDIYAQRYDSSGATNGANFKVNDDNGTSGQGNPSISMNNSSNFVIVWEDSRNGNEDIYSQRYDGTGDEIGSNFKVNDKVK